MSRTYSLIQPFVTLRYSHVVRRASWLQAQLKKCQGDEPRLTEELAKCKRIDPWAVDNWWEAVRMLHRAEVAVRELEERLRHFQDEAVVLVTSDEMSGGEPSV